MNYASLITSWQITSKLNHAPVRTVYKGSAISKLFTNSILIKRFRQLIIRLINIFCYFGRLENIRYLTLECNVAKIICPSPSYSILPNFFNLLLIAPFVRSKISANTSRLFPSSYIRQSNLSAISSQGK